MSDALKKEILAWKKKFENRTPWMDEVRQYYKLIEQLKELEELEWDLIMDEKHRLLPTYGVLTDYDHYMDDYENRESNQHM